MCSWVSIGYARLPSRDTLNLKLPSRSLRQTRQQPSYTYPGSEYDTFGAKMWQIYQGGDVKANRGRLLGAWEPSIVVRKDLTRANKTGIATDRNIWSSYIGMKYCES